MGPTRFEELSPPPKPCQKVIKKLIKPFWICKVSMKSLWKRLYLTEKNLPKRLSLAS